MLGTRILECRDKMEVVVLPEMFSTGFTMQPEKLAETMDGPTVNWMKHIAASRRIILTGSLVIEENGKYFNRLVWMLPNGQYGYYDKRHRFAFAGEHLHYSPGNRRLIASVKGWKINLQVCYDLRFPVWSRQQQHGSTTTGPEYDVIINVANWPEKRSMAWKSLLQARAIENQCYVAGVNRVGVDGNGIPHSGDSMVIDPYGNILYHRADVEEMNTITLERDCLTECREKLPFLRDADEFSIINEDSNE
jgi:predicted amidohydrolase